MNVGTNSGRLIHPKWTALGIALLGISCAETNPPAATSTTNSAPPPAVRTDSNVAPPLVEPATTAPAAQVASGAGSDQPAAATPQAKPSTPASPTNGSTPRVRLSAGVALAQTLPEGTTVMCSMDYQWIDGGPQQGCEYAWVVELGNGQRVAGPAKLSKRRGTIEAILYGIKPDQGPFKGAVFAKMPGGSPEQISDFVSLK